MAICLNQGTVPVALEVRSKIDRRIKIGEYDLSMEDFWDAALYVLTNTSLSENDPRRKFLGRVKKAQIVQMGPCERILC